MLPPALLPQTQKFWKRCGKVCRTICRTVHLHHIFWSWQRSLGDNNSIKLNVSVNTLRQRLCRGLYQNTVMQHPCCFIEVTHLVTEEPVCTSLHSGVYVRACGRRCPVKIWLVCAELFISCRLSWLGLSKKLSCLTGHCISHAPAYSCSGKLPGSQNSHQPPVEELSVTNPVFLPVENHIFLWFVYQVFQTRFLHSQLCRLISQLCIFPGY